MNHYGLLQKHTGV